LQAVVFFWRGGVSKTLIARETVSSDWFYADFWVRFSGGKPGIPGCVCQKTFRFLLLPL